jgi:riboflavin kinase/FMN adenylyltransferase
VRVFETFQGLPPDARGAAVALGNFDGVHLGHAAVVDFLRAFPGPLACLTFEPHPREVFRPEDPPFRLTLLPEKAAALASHGVDSLFALPFDRAFSQMTAEAFVTDVLVKGLGARQVACGEDFVFGHRRGGNIHVLREMGQALGFGVTVVPQVTAADGTAVSSTAVRQALALGDVSRAERLLGRPWVVAGTVEHGQARGRTIGFPTANIFLGRLQEPRRGVYAVSAEIDGRRVPGVANIGMRPTVVQVSGGAPAPLLEAHFFDLDMDLYGQRLAVALHGFIRPEHKFDSFAALTAQIAADARQARLLLDVPHA